MVNVNEAIAAIRRAGVTNVRSTPMPGQSATDGQYQLEVREGGAWNKVACGLSSRMAEDLISQATNRVILG